MLAFAGDRDALVLKSENARQRNADPRGTIVEFVEKLIEGLLEEIGAEQELRMLGLWD